MSGLHCNKMFEHDVVFVYNRPNQVKVAQLPPPEKAVKQVLFDETYVDYLYALMSVMRFVFLGLG